MNHRNAKSLAAIRQDADELRHVEADREPINVKALKSPAAAGELHVKTQEVCYGCEMGISH